MDLGRTRQRVAKWAARYDQLDPCWVDGRSRAPEHVANRSSNELQAQALSDRERLVGNSWAQIGAEAISCELEKLGAPAPRTSTESGFSRGPV